jgi:hypothetical protein
MTVVRYSARKAHPSLCSRDRPFGKLVDTVFHATRRSDRNDPDDIRVQLETWRNPHRNEVGAKFDLFSVCSKVWTERQISPGWKGGDECLVRVVPDTRIDVRWLTVHEDAEDNRFTGYFSYLARPRPLTGGPPRLQNPLPPPRSPPETMGLLHAHD